MPSRIDQGLTNLPLTPVWEIFIGTIAAGIVAYVITKFKKLEEKVEKSMNRNEIEDIIDDKLSHVVTRAEVKDLINDKIKPVEVLVTEINDRQKRQGEGIDMILKMMAERKD